MNIRTAAAAALALSGLSMAACASGAPVDDRSPASSNVEATTAPVPTPAEDTEEPQAVVSVPDGSYYGRPGGQIGIAPAQFGISVYILDGHDITQRIYGCDDGTGTGSGPVAVLVERKGVLEDWVDQGYYLESGVVWEDDPTPWGVDYSPELNAITRIGNPGSAVDVGFGQFAAYFHHADTAEAREKQREFSEGYAAGTGANQLFPDVEYQESSPGCGAFPE